MLFTHEMTHGSGDSRQGPSKSKARRDPNCVHIHVQPSLLAMRNPLHLTVHLWVRLQDQSEQEIFALVDTGSEVNLIRRGLIDQKYFHKSQTPLHLLTASSEPLTGGVWNWAAS